MAELFQTYEEEFKSNTDSLYANIARVPSCPLAERDKVVALVKEKLLDAEDSVDGMGIACRGAKEESEMLPRLKAYRQELDDLKKQFQRAQQALNKRDLLGDDEHDFGKTSAEHRALFGAERDTMALMESGNDLILQATRETLEIEEVAMGVMQDLSEQRTVMERFKARAAHFLTFRVCLTCGLFVLQDRLADINEGLDKAGRLMQEMMKRICGNKLMMALVIFLLVGGIVAIVWLRFFASLSWSSGGGSVNTTAVPAANRTRVLLEAAVKRKA